MASVSGAPRIAPGGFRELGLINWLVCRVVSRVAGVRDAQLFSTLGRQRSLFRAWLRFSAQMMPGGKISRHETELVILRVAHLRQCQYEQDHHARIGRRVGIDAEQLARISAGPSASGWSPRQRVLLSAVDELVHAKNIDEPLWAELRMHYDEPQLIELCLLIGQYEALATTIATLRIARDF
jgi:AhpD family alkylhydroperoxidase